MNQEFLLDQKKVMILVGLVLVLVLLVFIAGYLSGTIVGLPETEEQPVAEVPVVKPQPKPPVEAIKVPVVDQAPKPEVVAETAEPEPEEEVPAEKLYSVQVGAFRTQTQAEKHKQQLVAKGYQPYIYLGVNSKGVQWYTLRIGDFDQVDEALTAAHAFKAVEGSSVVLTHFDSLMMVRDDSGKRIEITSPKDTTPASGAGVKGPEAEAGEVSEGGESETVAEEPETAAEEPETVAEEPETVAEEPETVAEEPETAAEEPETAAEEPETVAEEPETVAEDSGTVAGESAAGGQATGGTGGHPITFALPAETPTAATSGTAGDESKAVGGLIADAETYQYAVQVGAFLNGDNAVKFAEKLRGRGYPAYVFHYTDTSGKAWHAVRAGDFKDPDSARAAAEDFTEKEQVAAIVTRIDTIKMVF